MVVIETQNGEIRGLIGQGSRGNANLIEQLKPLTTWLCYFRSCLCVAVEKGYSPATVLDISQTYKHQEEIDPKIR